MNNFNMLREMHCSKIKLALQNIRSKAPRVHLSFSTPPSREFLEQIIEWFDNIDPLLIINVGLQPNIGAGFTLRTDNKFFDFSLRQRLQKSSGIFVKDLERVLGASSGS